MLINKKDDIFQHNFFWGFDRSLQWVNKRNIYIMHTHIMHMNITKFIKKSFFPIIPTLFAF
jgi:hypothetical protein